MQSFQKERKIKFKETSVGVKIICLFNFTYLNVKIQALNNAKEISTLIYFWCIRQNYQGTKSWDFDWGILES